MKRLIVMMSCLGFVVCAADAANGPPPPTQPGQPADIVLPTEPPIDPGVERASEAVPHPADRSAYVPGVAPIVVSLADIPSEPGWDPASGSFAHIQGESLLDSRFAPEAGGGNEGPQPQVVPSVPDLFGGGTRAPGDYVFNFQGIPHTGWIPPDTILAVGPNHVVECVNSHWRAYSKLGNPKSNLVSFSAFFNPIKPAGWDGFLYDPRVLYAHYHDKWVIAALGKDDTNQESYCFVAISHTDDPTGEWWMWRFNQDAGNPSDVDAWWDYESLGADPWGLYLTGNYYYWVGGYKYSMIWSFNPAMFSGGASNGWRFWGVEWPAGGYAFGIQVAYPHSTAGGQETFFVNSHSGDGNEVCVWTMTGDRTNSPSLVRSAVSTGNYYWIGENVDQPGTAVDIDGGDARIMNAVYAQRRVFTVLTTDHYNDLGSCGAYTMKLNVDSATLEWSHVLIGGSPWYYFYPAIALSNGTSADNNLGLSMSFTKGDEFYAGGLFKAYTNQPSDGSGPFWGTANGEDWYVNYDSNGRNRWGDYSGQVYDWSTGHFWGAIEFAGPLDTWKTMVTASFSDAEQAFAAIDVTYPNGGEVFNGGDSVLITWDKLNLDPANDIYIFYHDGSWHQQGGPISTYASSWLWTVPNLPSSNARIYVGVWNGSSYVQEDWSDDVFTVIADDLIFEDGFESGNTSVWSSTTW